MAKEVQETRTMSFKEFLNLLEVDGLVENVKIQLGKDGNLFSQVTDPDCIMMGEIRFVDEKLAKMLKETITIFDLGKLISMISYVDDCNAGGKLRIKEGGLAYGAGPKSVIYRLGDDSVMKDLSLDKNIGDFIAEEELHFRLTNNEIRELLKALNIAERDGQLEILIEAETVRLVIGKIDKVFLDPSSPVESYLAGSENTGTAKIMLQTKVMYRVLRTMLQVPDAEIVIHCKPNYPAVMQLTSPLNDSLQAAFIVSPLLENELD